jgi:hypothetical protein
MNSQPENKITNFSVLLSYLITLILNSHQDSKTRSCTKLKIASL